MFLGKDDIQLGVNETLKDTSIVMSSMMASIVARVNKHADVAGLAEYSSVPVINAMCDLYHPLQGVADYLTMYEVLGNQQGSGLGLEGKKICWIGDATNGMHQSLLLELFTNWCQSHVRPMHWCRQAGN